MPADLSGTGVPVLLHRLGAHRRLVAAGLVGVAVVMALTALRPAAPRTVRIWVAARDLSGGSPLRAADVRVEAVPEADVPGGSLLAGSPVTGRLLAAPVRRGEPLTDVRILSGDLLSALPGAGSVAVPVRVGDGPAAAAVVHAGDRVDVIAAADPDNGGPAHASVVATGLAVLAAPAPSAGSDDGSGLLVLAADPGQAAALAQAAATRLS